MRETHQPPTTSTAGPPHDHTPGATALLPPSTEIDTIRQSPTNHNENSCPHARARRRILDSIRNQSSSCPHARARRLLPSFPRRRESLLSAWKLPPGRSGLDVSLGVAVPEPLSQ